MAEFLVRAFDLGPVFQVVHAEMFQLSSNPVLGYELRPGAPDGAARISSAGLRDREYERRKPPGVFRIVALGDSVTFGLPDRPLECWPRHLERLLATRAQGIRLEVLNLGVTGYNVLQVAERLRTLGQSFEPDLVLYAYVLNDPQESSIELEMLRDQRAAEERHFYDDLERSSVRWLKSSHLFLWVSSLRAPLRDSPLRPRRLDPAYAVRRAGDLDGQYFRLLHTDPRSRLRLRTGLDRLAAAASEARAPVAVAIFPLLLRPNPLIDVHQLVAEELRARGFGVIDLEPAFRDAALTSGGLGADFLHPNDAGARLAALAMIRGLEQLALLPAAGLGPWRDEPLQKLDCELGRKLGLFD